jgi:hypothetical protein
MRPFILESLPGTQAATNDPRPAMPEYPLSGAGWSA